MEADDLLEPDPSFEPNTVPTTFRPFNAYEDEQNLQGPRIDVNKLVEDAWSRIIMPIIDSNIVN